jgi:peptide deformylase
MILPVFTEPQPILHKQTQPVSEITPAIRELVENMRETMHNAQGIGLAAPQVGMSLAICVIEILDEDDEEASVPFIALINPRITWKSKRTASFEEGCLSLPGLEGPVLRPEKVRVKAKDLDGSVIEIETGGLFARALQHEIDHLHGVLFTSHLPKKKLHSRPLVDYPQL